MNPRFYLHGDGKAEIAILVKNKESGKMGIAIVTVEGRVFFAGAGTTVGSGDDFSWMDTWFYAQARAQAKLIGEALLVERTNRAAD